MIIVASVARPKISWNVRHFDCPALLVGRGVLEQTKQIKINGRKNGVYLKINLHLLEFLSSVR